LKSFPGVEKHKQAYLHVVFLTGNLSGRPGKRGRTGLRQSIGVHLSITCCNQVEVKREDLVILEEHGGKIQSLYREK